MQAKCALAAFFVLAVAPARAEPVVVEPRMTGSGAFAEERLPAARVSLDHIISGVSMRAPASLEKPSIHALLPWHGQPVCVRWKSADALYIAQAVYDLPADNDAGLFRLAYPSVHVDWLRELEDDRLGITISQGECHGDMTTYAPAIWNGDPSGPFDKLSVLLNARRANEVYLMFHSADGAQDLDCHELPHAARTGMDHICEIPLVGLPAGPLEIELYQIRRGQPDAPVTFSVMIPHDN